MAAYLSGDGNGFVKQLQPRNYKGRAIGLSSDGVREKDIKPIFSPKIQLPRLGFAKDFLFEFIGLESVRYSEVVNGLGAGVEPGEPVVGANP